MGLDSLRFLLRASANTPDVLFVTLKRTVTPAQAGALIHKDPSTRFYPRASGGWGYSLGGSDPATFVSKGVF